MGGRGGRSRTRCDGWSPRYGKVTFMVDEVLVDDVLMTFWLMAFLVDDIECRDDISDL